MGEDVEHAGEGGAAPAVFEFLTCDVHAEDVVRHDADHHCDAGIRRAIFIFLRRAILLF